MAFRALSKFLRNYSITFPSIQFTKHRGIMTSSFNYEKVQEELEKNPYYDKYAVKIDTLRKTNPEEFQAKLKDVEVEKNPPKEKRVRRVSRSMTKPKNLDDIMKLELLNDKKTDEIGQIWYEYHKEKDCVANVLTKDVFDIMSDRSCKFPMFIHPVPKDKGYEFYMSFFEENIAHFTPLRKYQELQENAPECLEVCYYTELKDSKNIVLLRGTYDIDEMTNLEANCLASSLQLYYSSAEGKRATLLELFTISPQQFQHMDLIAEFEAYSKPKLM